MTFKVVPPAPSLVDDTHARHHGTLPAGNKTRGANWVSFEVIEKSGKSDATVSSTFGICESAPRQPRGPVRRDSGRRGRRRRASAT
jgi:hypothetical protein